MSLLMGRRIRAESSSRASCHQSRVVRDPRTCEGHPESSGAQDGFWVTVTAAEQPGITRFVTAVGNVLVTVLTDVAALGGLEMTSDAPMMTVVGLSRLRCG